MRPSTTKLGKILHKLDVVDEPFTAYDLKKGKGPAKISNETYGKDSRIYITVENTEARRKLERVLERKHNVTTVNRGYWKGSSTLEVGVTYFKGNRHWE